MKPLGRRRLMLALLASLLLHLMAFGAPGWRLPTLNDLPAPDTDNAPRIEAHLAMPPAARKVAARSAVPAMQRSARPVAAPIGAPPAAPPGVLVVPVSAEPVVLTAAEPAAEVASQTAVEPPAAAPARPAIEFALPRRGSVRFLVSRGEQGFVVGQSTHHWNHDGKSYVLNSVTETTGLIAWFKSVRVVWLSQGEVGAEGLLPHEFHTEKDGVRGDAASFDWSGMKLGLSGGPLREVRLMPGSQDVLSMFYQLSTMLPNLTTGAGNGGDGSAPRGGFSLYVTTGRKLERYRFESFGEERLAVRHRGSQRALHLRTPAGDQLIDIWLGLDLRGLPLRIRYTDGKGDSFEQNADEIEFEGMAGVPANH